MLTRKSSKNQISDFQQSIFLNSETQQLEVSNTSYSDGKWEAIIGLEPSPKALLSADYRQGYQAGLEQKWDEKLTDLYL